LITTTSGRTITTDIVIAATGLSADQRIASLAGLDFERGIVVDARTLQTTDADIYALGDCISINCAACRFIEPIGKQAVAIANHIARITDTAHFHSTAVIP